MLTNKIKEFRRTNNKSFSKKLSYFSLVILNLLYGIDIIHIQDKNTGAIYASRKKVRSNFKVSKFNYMSYVEWLNNSKLNKTHNKQTKWRDKLKRFGSNCIFTKKKL